MNVDAEWTRRCADRLSQTWEHRSETDLLGIAAELCSMAKWRELAPELAAAAWLRLVGRPWSNTSPVSAIKVRSSKPTHTDAVS